MFKNKISYNFEPSVIRHRQSSVTMFKKIVVVFTARRLTAAVDVGLFSLLKDCHCKINKQSQLFKVLFFLIKKTLNLLQEYGRKRCTIEE